MTVALNLEGRVQISLRELREGQSGKSKEHRHKEEPEGACRRGSGWVARRHRHGGRLIELGRLREARSLGAQLAMTESELDPELEGNGVGKLNGISQRGGVIILAF